MAEIEEIAVTEINDSGRVLDNDINEWVLAWQRIFRRQRIFNLLKEKVFNSVQTFYTDGIYVAPYSHFRIFFNYLTSGTGYDLAMWPQFSLDGNTWYNISASPSADFSILTSYAPTNFIRGLRDYTPFLYFRYKIVVTGGPTGDSTLTIDVLADSDSAY